MISFIREIANGIDELISAGVISASKRIVVYGLDRYSFAIRTVLSHRDLVTSAFVSEDEALVLRTRRQIKDFACRYFRNDRDAIDILNMDRTSVMTDGTIILLAEPYYEKKKELLNIHGFIEGVDYFEAYDFYDETIDGVIAGKKKLDLVDIQECGREMLKILDKFCRDNGLRYWASGGTMLGAVRHNGFIPWDDDVDIHLPMKDYMRLLTEFPKGGRFYFKGFGPNGGGEFHDNFARLIDGNTILDHNMKIVRELSGIGVDIFPLVGVPDDAEERKMFFRGYQELEKSILQDFYGTDGDLEVFKRRFPEQEAFLTKIDFDDANYVGVIGTAYGENDFTHKEVYDETLRFKFDDLEVNVPKGYDEYLSSLYGSDWMELPPVSKRKSLHTINAYKVVDPVAGEEACLN